ncbi:MAG: hypothetical protein GY823_13780 [Flavobacteriaceae bacterium]|nr:hypothetical protein [Flavobacteriaceae bacterium]
MGLSETDLNQPCKEFSCVLLKGLRYKVEERYDEKKIIMQLKEIYNSKKDFISDENKAIKNV